MKIDYTKGVESQYANSVTDEQITGKCCRQSSSSLIFHTTHSFHCFSTGLVRPLLTNRASQPWIINERIICSTVSVPTAVAFCIVSTSFTWYFSHLWSFTSTGTPQQDSTSAVVTDNAIAVSQLVMSPRHYV